MKKNIILYYLYIFFHQAFFFSAILVPFFKEWGRLNQFQIQTLESFFMITLVVMQMPTGVLADRIGRKKSIVIGTFILFLGIFIYPTYSSFYTFMLAEGLGAIGISFISGAIEALLYDSLLQKGEESKAKEIFSRAESIKLFGMMLSALFGSFMVKYFDLRQIFFLSSIPTFIAFSISLFLKEPDKVTETSEDKLKNLVSIGFVKFLKKGEIVLIISDIIFISALTYFVIWFYQPALEKAGVSKEYFGIFHSLLIFIQILLLQLYPKVEKLFFGEKLFLKLTIILTSVGFLIVGFSINWISITIMLFLAGGFGLIRKPIYIAIFNKKVESRNRATINSFVGMVRSLVIAIINPIFGYLATWNLSYTFVILGFTCIVGLLINLKASKYL